MDTEEKPQKPAKPKRKLDIEPEKPPFEEDKEFEKVIQEMLWHKSRRS